MIIVMKPGTSGGETEGVERVLQKPSFGVPQSLNTQHFARMMDMLRGVAKSVGRNL